MTNEEKDLLIAYLVDAGEFDPEGDVEVQFQDWYQVRGSVVSGEVHYKAVLDSARTRKRSFERGYRLAAALRWTGDHETLGYPPKEFAPRQRSCGHGDPCICFVEGYASDLGRRRTERLEGALDLASRIRQVLDGFDLAGQRPPEPDQARLSEAGAGNKMIFVVHVVPPTGPEFEATVDEDNNWTVPGDYDDRQANLLASYAEIEIMQSGVLYHLDSRGDYANVLVAALPGSRVLYSVPPP